MKELTLWECDICHMKYDTQEECINCESHHATPVEIVNEPIEYSNVHWDNYSYPEILDIIMSNGKKKRYIRTFCRMYDTDLNSEDIEDEDDIK